ncbi:MAG TPA: hypothetical protein V6C78_23935 [Crinalium sp.]|jgi:hypothetical protein
MFHNHFFGYTVTSSSSNLTPSRRYQGPFEPRNPTPLPTEQQRPTRRDTHTVHQLRQTQQTYYLERRLFF